MSSIRHPRPNNKLNDPIDPTKAMTVRCPQSFIDRCRKAAHREDMSMNAWCRMRLREACDRELGETTQQ